MNNHQNLDFAKGKYDESSIIAQARKLFNDSKYNESLELLLKNESVIYGQYYQYLLLVLENYEKLEMFESAQRLINDELKVPYIPMDIEKILNEKLKDINSAIRLNQNNNDNLNIQEIKDNLVSNRIIDANFYYQLEMINIRLVLEEIKVFFANINAERMSKSMILNILRKQGVNEEFEMVLPEMNIKVIPSCLEAIEDKETFDSIYKILVNYLNKDLPALELSAALIQFYIFENYPLPIEDEEISLIAKSIYYCVCKSLNKKMNVELIYKDINIDKEAFETYCKQFEEKLVKYII